MVSGKETDQMAVLRESELRLARTQALAHVGDWEWDLSTDAVHWSDELYRIYGFEPGEIEPDYSLIVQRMHPASRDGFLLAIEAALKGEMPFEMDYGFLRRDGSEAMLHTIGQVFRDEAGVPVRMAGVVQDITERKRAEMLVKVSEDKFRAIFDNANDGILITDAEDQLFVEANQTICRMLGYSKKELCGLGIADIHPAADFPAIRAIFERQVRDGIPLAENIPVQRRDGTLFYADINSTLMEVDGKTCMVGIFRDITESKLTKERLFEKNTMLQTLIHAIPDQVFFKDTRGRFLLVNKAMAEVSGRGQEALIGLTDEELLPPEVAERCRKSDAEALRRGGPVYSDESYIDRNGETRFLDVVKCPICDSNGELKGLVGVARDITERKMEQEKLKRRDAYIRNILDTVDEGFIVVDRDYRILTANRAYCEQVGMEAELIMGRKCHEVSHKSLNPCYEEGEECCVKAVFATGLPQTAYHRHEDGDGNTIYVEIKAFPVRNASGEVTRAIETISDITEKRLLEEERLKIQKLEAIGTLAGGIAHDFNNLLQGVFGYILLAKMASEQNPESRKALEEAEKALHLTVKLTNQLLTFSKGGKPLKKSTDPRVVIDNAVRFALSGSSVGCFIADSEKLWPIDADEGQITQVIQNIILNAAQAMPDSGQVEITARNLQVNDSPAEGLEKGPYVEIAIRDEGIGIRESDLIRIFDPYFTTKEKGSGLGLATSYSIVKNHGGLIKVLSSPGAGSTFFIYLPASEPIRTLERPPLLEPAPELPARPGRILVMDDEEMIRAVAGAMIKSLGHRVEFAVNGEEAVARYQETLRLGEPFDGVILDLTIRGGFGGEETLQRILALDPGVKAVVSSGYADNPIVANYREYGFSAVLNKPYTLNGLRNVLNELLAPEV
jgi:PAS domain S-box-containing protein